MSEIFHHHHIPVLLNEALEHLLVSSRGIYVDATFGRGSHSQEILNRLHTNGRLFAFDKDPEAVAYAREHFEHDKRFTIFHSSFANIAENLKRADVFGSVNGILFDLGVSSPQLDNPERGFSFAQDGKLDMRMDISKGIDAATWLKNISEDELADVLWRYGEERFSRRIARKIVSVRAETPIETTLQLAKIIMSAMPNTKKKMDKHPATRSFQAIRIAINHELTELEEGLAGALDCLHTKGRLAVISFHSLEDRIVKRFMKQHEQGESLPRGLPIKGVQFNARLKTLGKPIKPTTKEINLNPRARSAILRIAEKKS